MNSPPRVTSPRHQGSRLANTYHCISLHSKNKLNKFSAILHLTPNSPPRSSCSIRIWRVPFYFVPKSLCRHLTIVSRHNSYRVFPLTSYMYQNSEALNNNIRFQNVHGIVESLKLQNYTSFRVKLWNARAFRSRVSYSWFSLMSYQNSEALNNRSRSKMFMKL